MIRYRSPASVAGSGLAAEADLAAGLDPGGNLDLEAPIADLDEPRRTVEGLLQGQVDLDLDVPRRPPGRPRARPPCAVGRRLRPAPAAAAPAPSKRSCERMSSRVPPERRRRAGAASGPAVAVVVRPRSAAASAAEEHAEEVGEALRIRRRGTRSGHCRPRLRRRSRRTARPARTDRRRGTARRLRTRLPAAPAPARAYCSQFAPSMSYCSRFCGSARTSLASLTSLNRRLGGLVAGIPVRVKLAGQPPVGLLDLRRSGRFGTPSVL